MATTLTLSNVPVGDGRARYWTAILSSVPGGAGVLYLVSPQMSVPSTWSFNLGYLQANNLYLTIAVYYQVGEYLYRSFDNYIYEVIGEHDYSWNCSSGVLTDITGLPPSQYTATISAKTLEYNFDEHNVPVSDMPINSSTRFHMWGLNTGSANIKFSVIWNIYRPDGTVAQYYNESWPYDTNPGQTHEFIGPAFPIDQTGTWTIIAQLLYSGGSLAVYNGQLGTVLAPIGSVTSRKLEYGFPPVSYEIPDLGIQNMPKPVNAKLHLWALNTASYNRKFTMLWEIRNPSNEIVENWNETQLLDTPPGGTHEFFGNIFTIDIYGTWQYNYHLYCGSLLLASRSGPLCAVLGEDVSGFQNFTVTFSKL